MMSPCLRPPCVASAVREPNGPNDALWADVTEYEGGSDHWIYQAGGFAIPTIYLRDWPDIYIHTHKDVVDNVDPTKIKRSAFIAAASGYFLATLGPPAGFADAALPYIVLAGAMRRLGEAVDRGSVHAFGPAGAESAKLAINQVARGDDVAYEIVNFIDGRRTVSAIRDAVSAEFAPVDVKAVAEYLELLAEIGAITLAPR